MRFVFVYLAILATCFLALGQPRKAPRVEGLQPGDQIRIRPVNVGHGFAPLFHRDLTVDREGKIAIPDFDLELDVHTLQPEDAEVIIRAALRNASNLTQLDLAIFATREGLPLPGQHCVTVGGRVLCPGPVAFKPGMTLAEAIDIAGGPTDSGTTKRIRVYREGTVRVLDLSNPAHAGSRLARNDAIDVAGKPWIGP